MESSDELAKYRRNVAGFAHSLESAYLFKCRLLDVTLCAPVPLREVPLDACYHFEIAGINRFFHAVYDLIH
jgi:hypothetical protein